jgi:hypothetical protein
VSGARRAGRARAPMSEGPDWRPPPPPPNAPRGARPARAARAGGAAGPLLALWLGFPSRLASPSRARTHAGRPPCRLSKKTSTRGRARRQKSVHATAGARHRRARRRPGGPQARRRPARRGRAARPAPRRPSARPRQTPCAPAPPTRRGRAPSFSRPPPPIAHVTAIGRTRQDTMGLLWYQIRSCPRPDPAFQPGAAPAARALLTPPGPAMAWAARLRTRLPAAPVNSSLAASQVPLRLGVGHAGRPSQGNLQTPREQWTVRQGPGRRAKGVGGCQAAGSRGAVKGGCRVAARGRPRAPLGRLGTVGACPGRLPHLRESGSKRGPQGRGQGEAGAGVWGQASGRASGFVVGVRNKYGAAVRGGPGGSAAAKAAALRARPAGARPRSAGRRGRAAPRLSSRRRRAPWGLRWRAPRGGAARPPASCARPRP